MVINKTPHPVHIVDASGKVLRTYDKGGDPIRLAVQTVSGNLLPDGTPTSRTVFGDPVGLPDYSAGTFYIVSQLVKNALPHRSDLLVPAQVVRDDQGNILGCQSLGR